ncbi:hypothetical protein [Listeria aquatica]|nr:hypothetical protein [Listeria aquatica]
MKISLPKSCENAPRKKIVADFTLDLLKQEQKNDLRVCGFKHSTPLSP